MHDDSGLRERRISEAWGILVRSLAQRAGGRAAQALQIDPKLAYCYHKFPRRWGFLPERGAVIRELCRRRGLVRAPASEPIPACAPCVDPDSRTSR